MLIDTGKTLLLDRIRKSTVQAKEAGGITQHIGASFFPLEALIEVTKPILKSLKGEIQIPGLLVIDTPGHEVFANLRKRGGAVADVAILVIDVLKGFEAQTYECIEILKERKTPFLVAVNKIDRIPGWKPHEDEPFIFTIKRQDEYVVRFLDEQLYQIIGSFSTLGFRADRYDRISDFTRTVALVPTSAKTGEGIPDLLTVLIGLTQSYLKSRLRVSEGLAKGTVLEVKEEIGLGMTINAILYDGTLHRGDTIVVGGKEKPIVTKVRALLLPKPLDEIRAPKDKFSDVESVYAAAGVKIVAPNLEDALAGSPILSVPEGEPVKKYVETVAEEISKIKISTEIEGIVLKTDALGSLEAIVESLKRNDIPVRIADVGDVSKRDIIEASIVKEKKPLYGVVLAFNVKVLPDAEVEANNRKVPIFRENIIYHLLDNYLEWYRKETERMKFEEFRKLIKPAKLRFLPGYTFRKAKPAIIGVEVLAGTIRPKLSLITERGRNIGEISQIQDRGEPVSEAEEGSKVAISLHKPIVGRHLKEGDILYVKVPEDHITLLTTKMTDLLSESEIEVLDEYQKLLRDLRKKIY